MNRKPRNEKEALLRAIALGESVDGIKPNAYENYWLREIAKSGGSGGGIKDVTELPKPTYKGTTVPNTGYVEKVYFNTNLSVAEVVEELKKVIDKVEGDSYKNTYLLYANDNQNIEVEYYSSIGEYKISYYKKVPSTSAMNYQIFNSSFGWVSQTEIDYSNGLTINSEVKNNSGANNNLITNLFSITPIYFETINENNFYKLQEQDTSKLVEVKGQPIPCDDKTYIDRVYINKNLSVDEVNNILDEVVVEDNGYVVCKSSSGEHVQIHKYPGGYEITGVDDFYLFDKTDFRNEYIEFKGTPLSSIFGEPAGLQNDKLKDLFYYTTYGTKSDLYTYDGEWCKLVKERPLKVIDVSKADTYEDADGSIIYDLIENGEYFLLTNGIDKIKLNFGKCKDNKAYGKFLLLTDSLRDVDYKDGYTSGSYDIDSSFTILENNFSFYIKVTDNLVYITVEDAV